MIFPTPLEIQETSESPKVSFNAQSNLSLNGRSLPENPHEFYQPLIDWLRAYISTGPKNVEVEVFLEYFNSSSGRYLLELFQVLEGDEMGGHSLLWKTFDDDELMIEKGEEYSKLLTIPVKIELIED